VTTTDRVEHDETTDDPGAPAARRARRRWPWLLGAGVVVLVVGTWLVLGLTPSFRSSWTGATDPEAVDEPPGFIFGTPESSVTEPSDDTYDGIWTFRNDGPLPATIRVVDVQPDGWTWRAQLFPLPGDGGMADEDVARATDEITVGPGESFGMTFAFGFGCVEISPGSIIGLDTVTLEATTLGLTRAVEVETDPAISVVASESPRPPARCAS
jgi:hypothetical protein